MFIKDFFLPLLLTYSAFTSIAHALGGGSELLHSHTLRDSNPPVEPGGGLPVPLYVELPLDHVENKSGTFRNRYWVDDYYYKPGGPVFFFDNGESAADEMLPRLGFFNIADLAREFNGLVIFWEHRFYGTSKPAIPNDMQFEPEQMAEYFRYHTIEQALEDVIVFAKQFSFYGLPGQDLRPGVTPWVFIGSSYPGARAAWMRSRNPEIFHASLASSAVVQLQQDMWQYYRVIEDTMDSYGYGNCSADMRAMARYIDTAVESGDDATLEWIMVNVTSGGPNVLSYFADVFSITVGDGWVSWDTGNRVRRAVNIFSDFQNHGLNPGVEIFCNHLQLAVSGATRDTIRTSKGVFADNPDSTELVAAFYAITLGEWWNLLLAQLGPHRTASAVTLSCGGTDKEFCEYVIGRYSWRWQVCSEFGAFHTMDKSRSQSLLPYTLDSFDTWQTSCVGDFGPAVAAGPKVAAINSKYGGWDMNPSNVLWTDGELDPWRAITPNSVEEGSPKRPKTTVVPNSGETPGGDTFFGVVIEGGYHATDIVLWNSTGLEAHMLFKSALAKWLPAFEPHEVNIGSSINKDGDDKSRDDSSGDDKGIAGRVGVQARGSAIAMVLVVLVMVVL